MKFSEALSLEGATDRAANELCETVNRGLPGDPADLGFLFFTNHHSAAAGDAARAIREHTGVRHLVGCAAESVIGGGREIEHEPAMSLWLGSLPGLRLQSFRLESRETPDGLCFPFSPENLFDAVAPGAALLFLGDSFSMPGDQYLRRFNEDHPGIPVIGGMASGARAPGENILLFDGQEVREGAVGVLVSGPVRVTPVVSQGCRPVGEPLVVTECDRNSILKLGGRPALARTQEIFSALSEGDRRLFRSAPHIGVAMTENRPRFGPGDFLIRNLVGVDQARGAVFISDYLRRGQTIQFHVRDGQAADLDLRALLRHERDTAGGGPARGALLFSCNGRGSRMFPGPDHDVSAIREELGPIPVAGFFAHGELGPVGGSNHLHGFTASIALFSEP
ncbi:MAG: FIST C-terminal domain-containing protein [Planctomycetes bacterium]|nr:FIST C-terminal domain-containing protein [Planctomycetota bacterium]